MTCFEAIVMAARVAAGWIEAPAEDEEVVEEEVAEEAQ